MILLLGASGYIGGAFANELRRRELSFIPLTRQAFDYGRFDFLFDYVRTMKPQFIINAAGYPGPTDRSPDQNEREIMMAANAFLPQMIARVCAMTKTPWGHVSTGEIFSGAKVAFDSGARLEPDLSQPAMRQLFDAQPAKFHGFSEMDEPNFTFHSSPSNFYSGTKGLAEEALREIPHTYIWRIRLPFSGREESCNWLSSLPHQEKAYDHIDSVSHLDDFVKAALDLWEIRAPFDTYNITNPGAITMSEAVEGMRRAVKPGQLPEVVPPHEDPAKFGAINPRSHCILDVTKLLKTGIRIRPAAEALRDSLEKMRAVSRSIRRLEPRLIPTVARA